MTSFEKFRRDKLSCMTYYNKFHGHPHNRENLCLQVSSFKEYDQYVIVTLLPEAPPPPPAASDFISDFIIYNSIFHHCHNSPVEKPPI